MNHWSRSCAILLGVGVLWGCGDDPTGPAVGESFTLAPGESVTLQLDGSHVRFLQVAEDSRCPLQAQCVWAGDGEVVIEIAPPDGDSAEHTLHTNEGQKAVALGRYELTLLELSPYPEVPDATPPEDYRATLIVNERLE